jgi:phage-related protein
MTGIKGVVWVGSSLKELKSLPKFVQRSFGISLFAVQSGETPPIAKPLKGFGSASVLELIENDQSGTYRAVYTVRFSTGVYVLHAFQKKSKKGISTPAHEITLIKERLKRAEEIHRAKLKESSDGR